MADIPEDRFEALPGRAGWWGVYDHKRGRWIHSLSVEPDHPDPEGQARANVKQWIARIEAGEVNP